MKYLMLLITAILYACTIAYAFQEREERCLASQAPLSKVINSLSHRLATQFGGNENLFYSPLSISVALGMLYLGARGTSAQEMEQVLHYDLMGSNMAPEDVHLQFRSFITLLGQEAEEYVLYLANGVFTQADYSICPEFTSNLENYYGAKQASVDFVNDGEGALQLINGWAANNTMNKIKKLFNRKLDEMTRMVLVNAVYFKGLWENPFSPDVTYPRRFRGVNGTVKTVPFMQIKTNFLYYSDSTSEYDFLELDYKGKAVSMIIALPQDEDKFPDLDINSDLLCYVRTRLRKYKVDVVIPKFKIEYEREILDDMRDLGLVKLFSSDLSNLTGIQENNDLFVSRMKHKAVVEVNEQGTEAAAITGINFYARSGHHLTQIFYANHPFVFIILDKRTGAILFTGRVVEP